MDTQNKDEDLIRTMIIAGVSQAGSAKFTPMKQPETSKNKWAAGASGHAPHTHQKENCLMLLSSKKMMESNRCFEYATPKNVYFEGRKVALEDVKHFQTTDEFDRLTYDELHQSSSGGCSSLNHDPDGKMITLKNFDHMIGAEPLRRESFTPPFKTNSGGNCLPPSAQKMMTTSSIRQTE